MFGGSVKTVLALLFLVTLTGKTAVVECKFHLVNDIFRLGKWEKAVTTSTVPPTPNPPPYYKYPLMARYIIHNSGWVSLATISTQPSLRSYPFVTLKSLSDGMKNNSTGVPYLYMTNMDISGADVLVNNRVTFMATLAQSDYCENRSLDPQDPQCAKVMISGPLIRLRNNTAEYKFGLTSLYEKHPAMRYWPDGHGFYVAKVIPQQILVLDFYGGAANVSVKDYFNATLKDLVNVISVNDVASAIQI